MGTLLLKKMCFLRIAPQTWMTIAVMLRSMLPGGAAAISSDAMCSIIARAALKSEILLRAANEMGRRRNKSEKSQNER
jgi:hypothetical protein